MHEAFRTIILTLFVLGSSFSVFSQIPLSRGRITDLAGLYSAADSARLNAVLEKYQNESGVEIAILTMDSTAVTLETLAGFGMKIFLNWRLNGWLSEKGVLVLILPENRLMRISFGHEIRKIFSDQETQEVIDQDFVPAFREGHYFEGTLKGVDQLGMKINRRISDKKL